jgi:fructose-1,6-bisphosphatase II
MAEKPDRNIALELVRVTEAAALASGRWMGRGNKEAGDHAAVEAMRLVLGSIEMDGVVVIGEGEKDDAPMLFNGEKIGTGHPPQIDIAVDPLEGTRLLALGRPNAISVVAMAERGALWSPGPGFYMDKIVVGPGARGAIDITQSPAANLRSIAQALGRDTKDLTLVTLDRPRNNHIIEAARNLEVRIRLITDGDVSGALMAVLPDTGVDVLMGIGGTPEGVITACALQCTGGEIQGRLSPQSDEERQQLLDAGLDINQVVTTNDLAKGENIFFAATGVTDGELLQGVRYSHDGATTSSLVMRAKSNTIRRIEATHHLDKLKVFSEIAY